MTCTDPRTGISWVGGVTTGYGLFLASKDPGANTLGPTFMAYQGFADKPLMTTGPAPGDPSSTHVYCAFNNGVVSSADLGATWNHLPWVGALPVYAPQPLVSSNGHLHIPYGNGATQHRLHQSFDGGVSLNVPSRLIVDKLIAWPVQSSAFTPGTFRSSPFTGFASDPEDDRLYFVYPDVTSIESNGFNVDLYYQGPGEPGRT